MKWLANAVVQGPLQASLVTASLGLLSLLVPLVSLLSLAAVALVGLGRGLWVALRVSLIAMLLTSVFGFFVLQTPWLGVALLLVLWLPTCGVSEVHRHWRSLGLTAQVSALGALILVVAAHLFMGDPSQTWERLLDPLRQALVADGLLVESESIVLLSSMASWLTGMLAAAFMLQLLLGLFIARWWQALLYNPGGFGEEFRAYRLSRISAILLVALLVLAGVSGGGNLASDLAIVLAVLFVLQGLAIIHQLVAWRRLRRWWLILLYVVMFVLAPQIALLIALLGFVDVWADLRRRAGGPRAPDDRDEKTA